MAEMSHSADAESSQATRGPSVADVKREETVYEIGFHLVPTVAESDLGGVVDTLHGMLAPLNAEIIKEEFPRKLQLAYMIERSSHGKREKYTEAYFGWIKFALAGDEIEAGTIPALQEKLRAMKEVLRFICIETVREDAAPRRAIFTSDRLEGETIKKPVVAAEQGGEVSEEELNKSIDALVS